MRNVPRWLGILGVLVLVGAACGGDDGDGGGGGGAGGGEQEQPTIEPAVVYNAIGETEGELSLIAWNGYTEDGSVDKNFDWVTPFEEESGCDVTVKYADTSDEMVTLMRQGGGSVYDGVSASGDATNRLIAGQVVGAIDPALFPELGNVIAPLNPDGGTNTDHYIVDGNAYGVPYMYGPNFLMYNTEEVSPAPTSWDVTFEPELNGEPNPYAGKITAYDSPIYIADAAMYLMAHNPDLGITDPYELTQEQLDAAVELLKGQAPLISKYWALYTDEIDGFVDGSMVVGTAWPINLSYAELDAPVDQLVPSEGVTGWADTWMISANAPHPNCMLKWMDWTLKPDVQAEVAYWYGAAGSNVGSCDEVRKILGKDADLVDTVRYGNCGDAEFLNSLFLWKTPQANCGDDRGAVCVDYSVWQQAWTEIRGA
jgi:putative spermidine/putrescine transport system substrate-binding protein